MTFIRCTLFLCCCLVGNVASAQFCRFNPNDTTYIFGDKINVRSLPATDAATVTQLTIGEEVVIQAQSEQSSTIGGLTLPWFKVSFKGGQTGFVWGGLLSALGKQQVGDVRFVASATKTVLGKDDMPPTYTIELRAARNGTVLDKTTTVMTNSGSIQANPIQPNALGLKGYKALVKFGMSYEACGYPWEDWYVLWNGSKLVPLPTCTSISDAGVFSHVEYYSFPQNSDLESGRMHEHFGTEEEIFFSIAHSEREEMEDGSGSNENSWTRTRKMIWDGKNWSKPKNMGEPKE